MAVERVFRRFNENRMFLVQEEALRKRENYAAITL
jgi:hypothetical protein